MNKHLYLLLLIPLVFVAYPIAERGISITGDFPYLDTPDYAFNRLGIWRDSGGINGFELLPRFPVIAAWYLLGFVGINSDLATKSMVLLGFLLSSFTFYFSFLRFFKDKFTNCGLALKASAIMGSIFYAYNVWSFNRVHHWYLWIGYSVLPLFFISVYFSLKNPKSWKYILLSVFLWTLASSTPHMTVFYATILGAVFLVLILNNIHNRKKEGYIQIIKPLLSIVLFYILVNFYWIYPYVLASQSQILAPASYELTEESMDVLNQGTNFVNTFRILAYWLNSYVDVHSDNLSSFYLWLFASFVVPIIAFSSLLFKRIIKYSIFFCCAALIGIVLTMGFQSPFDYFRIALSVPFLTKFVWLFRDLEKWSFLIAFAYSFLMGLVSFQILLIIRKQTITANKKYLIAGSLLFLIIGMIAITSYPFYKSTMDLLKPVLIPVELNSLNAYLSNLNIDKVYFVPYPLEETSWSKTGSVGDIYQMLSKKPSIESGEFNPLANNYYNYLKSSIMENRTNQIDNLMYPLGTSYLIFHNDTWNIPEESYDSSSIALLKQLYSLQGLNNVKNIGLYNIFKTGDSTNNYPIGVLHIPQNDIAVVGGLDTSASLNVLLSFSSARSSLTFLDQHPMYPEVPANYDAFIFAQAAPYNSFVLSFVDKKHIIAPFEATYHHEPGELWSKARIMDPRHAEYHPLLESLGISNWDFDFGKGLVMTTAMGTNLSMPVTIEHDANQSGKSDTLSLYVRYLENQKGGLIKVYFDGKLVAEIDTFDKISNNFVWKKLALLNLTAEQEKEKHTLTIENVDGFNAVNVFALIPQSEMNRLIKQADNLLDNKTHAIYLMEAESNFYNEGVDSGFQNLFVVGGNNMSSSGNNMSSSGNNMSSSGNNMSSSSGNNMSSSSGNNTVSGKTVPEFTKTIDGQFTVPQNTNTATLQFLTAPNPDTSTNSTYLIKNLEIVPASRNVSVLETDCNSDNFSISDSVVFPIRRATQLNWQNYQPDILSTSLKAIPNINHTLGTLGNNMIGNTTIVNNTIGNATAGDKSLKVDIKQGNFSYWGVISTDFIPANENSCYSFSQHISTESVTQLHSKVFYFDSNKKEIKWDFVFGGQDGSFEQVYDKIILSPPGTKFMKLQMWVSPNSETYSSFLLKDVILNRIIPPTAVTFKSNYANIENLNSTGQHLISMNSNVKNDNEISNESNNTTIFKVSIDKNASDKIYKIQTKPFSVKENQIYNYTTTINAENLNSISVVASFKNDSDVVESNGYGSNASNGNVLSMGNGSQLSSKLDIIKPSNYVIALRAKTCETCTFIRVSITPVSETGSITNNNTSNNNTNPLSFPTSYISLKNNSSSSSSSLKWLYSNNTYLLKRGTYDLKIYSDSKTDLDSIIVYSVDSSPGLNHSATTSLEDVFNPQSSPTAQIVNYKKINPTKYILDIKNATRPYTISFAESYDPMWIAYSDTNNKDSDIQNGNDNDHFKTSSVPLYSIVNGFFINKTGDYTLIIEYKPQDWFIQGGIVSIITVIAIFMIYFLRHKISTAPLKKAINRNRASKSKT